MSVIQHHIHFAITCSICDESQNSRDESTIEEAVKTYETDGWGFASYQNDHHKYLVCPRCKREIPEIPI